MFTKLQRLRALSTPFGTATAFWCVGTGLTFTWVGFKAPQKLKEKTISTAFGVHLVCAGTTSLVCIWNLCLSPSQGPVREILHRGFGRFGMVTSILGTGCG